MKKRVIERGLFEGSPLLQRGGREDLKKRVIERGLFKRPLLFQRRDREDLKDGIACCRAIKSSKNVPENSEII